MVEYLVPTTIGPMVTPARSGIATSGLTRSNATDPNSLLTEDVAGWIEDVETPTDGDWTE